MGGLLAVNELLFLLLTKLFTLFQFVSVKRFRAIRVIRGSSKRASCFRVSVDSCSSVPIRVASAFKGVFFSQFHISHFHILEGDVDLWGGGQGLARVRLYAARAFYHLAVTEGVPARLPLAKARIYEPTQAKTLKNVHYVKYSTKVAIVSDFICNFAMPVRFLLVFLQH